MKTSQMQRFVLTNGKTIDEPMVTASGESFDWLGQRILSEVGMREATDDEATTAGETIICVTPRGNETARMVDVLYREQSDPRYGDYFEAIWDAFCEAASAREFRALIARIYKREKNI